MKSSVLHYQQILNHYNSSYKTGTQFSLSDHVCSRKGKLKLCHSRCRCFITRNLWGS